MKNPTQHNVLHLTAVRPASALAHRKRLKTAPAPAVDMRCRTPAIWPRDLAPHRQTRTPAPPVASDLRFQRAVERVHRLGPRVVAELLAELDTDLRRVEQYAGLDRFSPATLHTIGADRWPVAIFGVPGP